MFIFTILFTNRFYCLVKIEQLMKNLAHIQQILLEFYANPKPYEKVRDIMLYFSSTIKKHKALSIIK